MRWEEIKVRTATTHGDLEAALEGVVCDAIGCREEARGCILCVSDSSGWREDLKISPGQLDSVESALWSSGEDDFLRELAETVIAKLRDEGKSVDGDLTQMITVTCRSDQEAGG